MIKKKEKAERGMHEENARGAEFNGVIKPAGAAYTANFIFETSR